MGHVRDLVISLVGRQLDEAHVVVWYDPDRFYQGLVPTLELGDTHVASYDGSFLTLRRSFDSFLDGDEAPRLLVYVPLEREKSGNALVEAESYGTVLAPGAPSAPRNMRPSVVVRTALKGFFSEEELANLVKSVAAGETSLDEVDRLAGTGNPDALITLLYGNADDSNIALDFLTSTARDKDITHKGALEPLTQRFSSVFGFVAGAVAGTDELRSSFARFVLCTDLAAGVGSSLPSTFRSLVVAKDSKQRAACVRLAAAWRDGADTAESYEITASGVAKELQLLKARWTQAQLVGAVTFAETEELLQENIAGELRSKGAGAFGGIIAARKDGFWAGRRLAIRARWGLLEAANTLRVQYQMVEAYLHKKAPEAADIFARYTSASESLCMLDSAHRALERQWQALEADDTPGDEQLAKLVAELRGDYTTAAGHLTERFMEGLVQAKWRLEGFLQQRQVFARVVKPLLEEGKVAYIWADALRFEMARELATELSDSDVTLVGALGTLPSITPVGMAALLPGAERLVLADVDGKMTPTIDDRVLLTREQRIKYLSESAGVPTVALKVDDLLPKPKKKVRDAVASAQLVLVTMQEIDALCETGEVGLARKAMDTLLHDLRQAIHQLGQMGCTAIVLTADHGHLFGEELGEEMKIDPPGGQQLELHRRVWIGHGGAEGPAYVRVSTKELGLGEGLDVAVPAGVGGFKVAGGSREYFHGGASPEELIIPVMTIIPHRGVAPESMSIAWMLAPGSSVISGPLFSVVVSGDFSDLFATGVVPKIRLEVRDPEGTCVSTMVSATYGFEEGTHDVQLRMMADSKSIEPDTVVLNIGDTTATRVSVVMLDAVASVELAHVENLERRVSVF
jgi:hypothetical protein